MINFRITYKDLLGSGGGGGGGEAGDRCDCGGCVE